MISAVITAFNEEKTVGDVVRRALQHVDEVVVVDDASTDNTAAIAAKAGATVIRHQQNMGVLATVLIGLREAKGEISSSFQRASHHGPDAVEGKMHRC